MEQRAMVRLTETELEVLDFMEELRRARLEPARFSFAWGAKRRRSAIDASPSPLSPKKKKPKVSSPATTLAFPQSESEEKLSSKPLKIVSLTKLPKKIEDLQKRCDSLSTEREGLLQVKEEMLSLKRKLEEENSLIKEKLRVEKVEKEAKQHQQLQLCSELEPSTALTLDFTLAHHRPLIVDQATVPSSPCTTRDELFDLNVAPAEESPSPAATPLQAVFVNLQSLKMSEMARRNRMARKEKIQSKNNGRLRAVR